MRKEGVRSNVNGRIPLGTEVNHQQGGKDA